MTRTEKGKITVVVLLACVLLAGMLASAACTSGVVLTPYTASAEGVTAGSYGGTDIDSLWYAGADEQDLNALRGYVSSAILPVLEANTVEPVVIAVVDTGLDLGLDIFKDVLMRDPVSNNVLGYNSFAASQNDTDDLYSFADESSDGHGTAVASVIAILIKDMGLQDYIKIYPVKASYSADYVAELKKDNPNTDITTNSFDRTTVRLGIAQAVSEEVGAEVVNLSLCSTKDSESGWRTDTALAQVIERATQSATVVAAAGNLEYNSSSVSFYPAAYSGVVGVMAQGADGYHDTTNYGTAYDIFAPGEGILVSTENGVYRTEGECTSGTSMASPIVSFAAALLRLSLTAEQLSGGDELPRTSVITRMITGLSSDDGTVDAPDGKAYKKLDMMKLVSEDIDDIDYGWLPVTGIGITATRAGRDVSSGASVTVQTLRETGAGRSYLEFSAVLTPAGDTDPSVAEQVQWTLVEYETKDGKETEVATHDLGTGATIGHLFDTAGSFGVRASIKVPTAVDPFVAEFRLTVSHPGWNGSQAYVVTSDYIASDAYVKGTGGAVMAGTDLYGRGSSVSLTVTTVEDVACDTVNWYVNGAIAGTGKTFVYTPPGAPGQELEITARVQFSNGSQSFVQNTFVVHYKSWAAHPLFAILWTGLGIGVIAASVLIAMRVKSRKAQAAAAAQDAPAAVEEAEEKESPIRKK